jgi:hypothetical protein
VHDEQNAIAVTVSTSILRLGLKKVLHISGDINIAFCVP